MWGIFNAFRSTAMFGKDPPIYLHCIAPYLITLHPNVTPTHSFFCTYILYFTVMQNTPITCFALLMQYTLYCSVELRAHCARCTLHTVLTLGRLPEPGCDRNRSWSWSPASPAFGNHWHLISHLLLSSFISFSPDFHIIFI